uniref:ATP synthase F0 subunit 8 n=1 Tax=Glycera tesselata TaxID=529286 RepID=A0A0S3CR17_9ANNE|nr:ATP synthase F0 subunit 8 [Glycera tesselata]
MPHLSPMPWIMTLILFIFMLMIFISTIWWQQTPSFPNMKLSSKQLTPRWHWN